jgi:hypothetical protein
MEKVKIVNHGVDTLVVNVHYVDRNGNPRKGEITDVLLEKLEDWKKQAQEASELVATDWTFQGVRLLMRPNGGGRGHWQWLLISSLFNLSISRGRWNGGIAQVRFASAYLWSSASLEEAVRTVHRFLELFFGMDLFLQVSEVHLCADVVGWDDITTLDYRQRFVSRSRQRPEHSEADWMIEPGEELKAEDFTFGLVRTGLSFSPKGTVSCVIYNKSREIKRTGKEWNEDKWLANDWEEGETVWRVEFRFEREALHEIKQGSVFHGIENVYDLSGKLAMLWAYAAGHVGGGSDGWPDGWLRYVLPGKDKSRSRWPVHPVWACVQGAFQQERETPEHFGEMVRKRRYEHNIRKGLEGIMGYATSIACWVGGEVADPHADLSVFLHWLALHGQEYLTEKDLSFGAEVQRKRIVQGVQE